MRSKRILIGVTGGIAAYKIPTLIRLLAKKGYEIRCIMTPGATEFVSPLVLSVLTKYEVQSDLITTQKTWNNHVELAEWADLFVIAPLTANTLAKMASGICDNLLLSVYFSMKGKTLVSPAMDLDMYKHPTVFRNLEILQMDGVKVLPAEYGELASGLIGQGRMPEPETILNEITVQLRESSFSKMNNKRILITAGPTFENIDPVRFIGNHSTGKMGFALAEICLQKGALVTLISGPTNLKIEYENLRIIDVVSAEEMLVAVQEHWTYQDAGIFAAAVADYRPKIKEDQKIKKKSDELTLELVKNPDVLGWAGKQKMNNQLLVGFALETNNELKNAIGKLKSKNLDFIILNSLNDAGAGFETDTNKVTILGKNNQKIELSLKSKYEIAEEIVLYLEQAI
jgi:phosphopantothenoylcysteine decarboxylase/phosphopantothenate--cysteine ligase